MFFSIWKISAAVRGYLRFHMPSNITVDRVRSPGRARWVAPLVVIAVPVYLYAASLVVTLVERGAPAYLRVLATLFVWNAMKFFWAAVLSPVHLLRGRLAALHGMKTHGARVVDPLP